MKQLFYITTLFLLTNRSFGQTSIKGVVSNSESKPLLEVKIIEVGTMNETTTDFKGQYEIEVSDTSSVLEFSFIGLVTKTYSIGNKKELNVRLKASPSTLVVCYFPIRFTEIGYSSGINFTPIGFKVKNQTPYLWGINFDLESSITYRKKDTNKYINFYLRKFNLFSIKSTGIGVIGEYRRFSDVNNAYSEFTLSPTTVLNGFLFSIGYTRQTRKSMDIGDVQVNGLYLGIFRSFPFGNLSFDSQYLFDLWQFDIDFSKHFYKPNLTVAIGYERFYTFDEFDFTLSYRINY